MLIDKQNNGIIHEHLYEDIVEEGNQFKKSADILFLNWTKTFPPAPLTFPTLVCYSFCCELYLKGILLKYNSTFKKVHKLSKLFEDIPKHLSTQIISDINNTNFIEELDTVSNMFEEIRYFFDVEKFGHKNPNIKFIRSFSDTLCKVANNEIIKKQI